MLVDHRLLSHESQFQIHHLSPEDVQTPAPHLELLQQVGRDINTRLNTIQKTLAQAIWSSQFHKRLLLMQLKVMKMNYVSASSLGNDVPHKAVGQSVVYWSCQWVCPLHAQMSSANKTTDQLSLMSHAENTCINWAWDMQHADSAEYLHLRWDSEESGTHFLVLLYVDIYKTLCETKHLLQVIGYTHTHAHKHTS